MNKIQLLFRTVGVLLGLMVTLVVAGCAVTGNFNGTPTKVVQCTRNPQKQFSYANTVYEIKKTVNLRGHVIEIPAGSTLFFNGGGIKNGTFIGKKTLIAGRPKINAKLSGTYQNKEILSSWFANSSDVTIAAVKAVCASNSVFVVDDTRNLDNTLYVFGKGALKGRGGSLNFTVKPTNEVCILCGTDGQKPMMWSGSIDSVVVNISDYKYGIALCNVSHCSVTNNTLNATSVPSNKGGKLISRFNNGNFTKLSGVQTDILIEGNVLNMHGKTDGTESKSSYESISVCDFTDNARILNNTINNSTDDVGIHSCTNIRVEGNTITTEDGRIYCADSKDVNIVNNNLTCFAYSMGIMITMESQNRVCENMVVKDNKVFARGPKGLAYGIRVNNGKHITIENNQVEGQLHIGYQDYVLENLSHKPVTLTKEDKIVDYVVVKDNVFTQINGSGWNKTDNTPKSVVFEGNLIKGPKFVLSNIPQVKSRNNTVAK